MSKTRYTKAELEMTLDIADVVQVVTPQIAGVGMLMRLDSYTMV